MAIVCLNQLSKRENNVTNGKNYSSSIEVGTSSNSTFDNVSNFKRELIFGFSATVLECAYNLIEYRKIKYT